MADNQKPKIVFAFVEAGLGHIMPMRAIADAFENKYGEQSEVVRTYFYQDKKDSNMKFVEDELVREVKLHNKRKAQGRVHFALMRIFGTKISMSYLMKKRYKKGFKPSLDYLKELDADVIVNTHFSTLYCACEARHKKLIDSKVVCYCPDPIIGLQWDNRLDLMGVSSVNGKKVAQKHGRFKENQVALTPFLIRKEVENYTKGKDFYRQSLGLPTNNFTILLADGAYGAGKLKKTVYELFDIFSKDKDINKKITIVAVCGKNETLYNEFNSINVPENIIFKAYGFTDKTLELAAASDLFIGKAGASNLAEPVYFGSPCIVTFRATAVEKWISAHFEQTGCVVRQENIKKAVKLALDFAKEPQKMKKYQDACKAQHCSDGPKVFADIIWERMSSK